MRFIVVTIEVMMSIQVGLTKTMKDKFNTLDEKDVLKASFNIFFYGFEAVVAINCQEKKWKRLGN